MVASLLIVDDDPNIRAFLEDAFSDEGFHVRTARHGAEALALVAQEQPGVVLLDLNMPIMDGWTCCTRLKELDADLPVVIMTAGQQADAEARTLGARASLAKPFELDEALATVERVL